MFLDFIEIGGEGCARITNRNKMFFFFQQLKIKKKKNEKLLQNHFDRCRV
jgi:hypothetical protein